jgi:preprotein translocase subunit YajC
MLLQLLILFAQAAGDADGKPTPKPGGDGGLGFLIPFALVAVVFWLVVLRPMQRRQEQEAAEKLNSLQKGDKVLTIGGIYGHVVSVAEKEDEIVVKLDDNVRVKMVKSAIHRNFDQEERLKSASEKKEAPKEAPKA